VGLERAPLSLMSTTEELLERKSSVYGLEYGRRDSSRWQRGNLYQQKLALTSPTNGGLSVDIVFRGLRPRSFFLQEITFYSLLFQEQGALSIEVNWMDLKPLCVSTRTALLYTDQWQWIYSLCFHNITVLPRWVSSFIFIHHLTVVERTYK
jgi:hypothetical protein